MSVERGPEQDYGNKIAFDPTWKGPDQNRQLTDVAWLVVFLLVFVFWIYVVIFAYANGDTHKLLAPSDNEGRKCGIDKDVENKPDILFFDFTKCGKFEGGTLCQTPQVCVERCPSDSFDYEKDKKSLSHSALVEKLICRNEVDKTKIKNVEQTDELVRKEKCAKMYYPSMSVGYYCIPKLGTKIPDVNQDLSPDQLEAFKKLDKLMEIRNTIMKILDDIKASVITTVFMAIFGGAATIGYIVALRYAAVEGVYSTLAAVSVLLTIGIFLLIATYNSTEQIFYLIIMIAFAIPVVAIVFALLFFRATISLTCQIVEEASRAVVDEIFTLAFSILPWILTFWLLTVMVKACFLLATVSDRSYYVNLMDDKCTCPPRLNYQANSTCDPDEFRKHCKVINTEDVCLFSYCAVKQTQPYAKIGFYLITNVLGFIWIWLFISAVGELILYGAFGTWYWTLDKKDVTLLATPMSIYRTFRYHLGTAALGSLISSICGVIKCLQCGCCKSNTNVTTRVTPRWCCSCYLCDKLVKLDTSSVFIMVAIHGRNFCLSAKDVFNLLGRNIGGVLISSSVIWLFRELGKILIVGLCILFTWWLAPEMNYKAVPLVVVGVVSYTIVTSFFKVHAAAIDTLFLCYLEDGERNNGSNDRPYYMSPKLRNVMKGGE